MIEDRGNPAERPEYTRYIRLYMLTQVEATIMVADLIYEEFGMTMEELSMQASLAISDTGEGFWNVWAMSTEIETFDDGTITNSTSWFYVFINATTGKVLEYLDVRDLVEMIDE